MPVERRKVTYEGDVQGVGFRMTARRLSAAFAVSGYVRNLADVRVELVAEGEPEVVAAFLGAIRREFADLIRDAHDEPAGPEAGRLVGFTIRP